MTKQQAILYLEDQKKALGVEQYKGSYVNQQITQTLYSYMGGIIELIKSIDIPDVKDTDLVIKKEDIDSLKITLNYLWTLLINDFDKLIYVNEALRKVHDMEGGN